MKEMNVFIVMEWEMEKRLTISVSLEVDSLGFHLNWKKNVCVVDPNNHYVTHMESVFK